MQPVARVIKSQDKPSFATSIVRALFRALYAHNVSAFTKSHLQVTLYNTKYLKRSYHIIATDMSSQY
jgi:hypothetical protein